MNKSSPIFAITSNLPACSSTVARVQNEILSALKNQTKVILLTGSSGKGKSTLLRSIANSISSNHRLIFFDGKDSASNSNDEYNFVENFICESSCLAERIVIIIDAMELVPEQTLNRFLLAVTANTLKNNNFSVLLSGSTECKALLDELSTTLKINFAHSSLDNIGEEDIRLLAAKKEFRIKPKRHEYNFEASALRKLSIYVDDDLQLADVALEWCIAITNNSNTDLLSSSVVEDAIYCIQQYSIDHDVALIDAYPSVDEVNNYLEKQFNNIDEDKEIEADTKSATANASSKPFVSRMAFETIDLNDRIIPRLDVEDLDVEDIDADLDLEVEPIPDTEVIPQEWIATTRKMEPQRKATYITAFTLCALIVISFIAIENKPFLDTAFNKVETISKKPAASSKPLPEASIANDSESNHAELLIAKQDDKAIAVLKEKEFDLNNAHEDEQTIQISIHNEQAVASEIDVDQQKQIENSPLAALNETKIDEPIIASETDPISPSIAFVEEEITEANKPTIIPTTLGDNSVPANSEIDALLVLASQQFAAKQLTTPVGDNALETYRKILSLKPEYALAQQGIKNIHARYLNWANYYLNQNQTERSKFFYKKAYEIDPSDLVSKEMASNLSQKLSQTNRANVKLKTSQLYKTDNATSARQQTSTNTKKVTPFNITGLLIKARQQLRDKQLTTPANNNAYETYREVLKVEPENAAAIRGISLIKKSYINWAETDVRQNELRRAVLFYRKALEIDPQDTKIARRLDEITSLTTSDN